MVEPDDEQFTHTFMVCSFLQMILPCNDNVLRGVTLDRPVAKVSRFESLPYDIERAILEIIEKEINV